MTDGVPWPLVGMAALVGSLSAAVTVVAASWWVERRARRHVLGELTALAARSAAPVSTQQLLRQREDAGADWLRGVLGSMPFLQNADTVLEQAGLTWARRTLFRTMAESGVLGGLVAVVLSGSPLLVLTGLGLGATLPYLYVLRCRSRRIRKIEEQLPEAIDMLSRAIRAGHAVPTSLRMVAEDAPEPLASEFRRVFEEQKYGLPFDDSMQALARRVDLIDVRVMVVALLVQREIGGNLAEVLEKIATIIRTRFNLRRQLQVYTAQGRVSGYVLSLMPIALGLALALLDPGYVRVLFEDPAGRMLLAGAVVLQLVGYSWIWWILRVDY